MANKGNVPWNVGVPRTQAEKEKISKTRKDRLLSGEIIHPKGMLGKRHAPQSIQKIKENSSTPDMMRRRIIGSLKKCLSLRVNVVCRFCGKEMSVTRKRSKSFVFCSYKCLGLSSRKLSRSIHDALRSSGVYKNWRKSIYQRDSYTCQECGKVGGRLECHHIKPLSVMIGEHINLPLDGFLKLEEFWSLDNGVTLCKKCHTMTDSYGWKSK